MNAADWIVDFLIKKGVTDTFGLPGAVVLELLYAMERRKPELTPHLTYHEQGAAFAACGYAQANGKLGVAYATRGPGMTNMVTAIADAYYDSTPTMFFTAHSSMGLRKEMRILNNQEMDTLSVVSDITKYSVRIDKLEDVKPEIQKAYEMATTGRVGPVFVDILASVLKTEITEDAEELPVSLQSIDVQVERAAEEIAQKIAQAKRPVLMIGCGVRQSNTQQLVQAIASKAGIPILSSRTAQDVLPQSELYFGHVGSHATRYSNFIVAKADLIVALGNRMSFPVNSKSFRPITENATCIRVDVDASEFSREIPNSTTYNLDLKDLLPVLAKKNLSYAGQDEWLTVARKLKDELKAWDSSPVVDKLMRMMKATQPDTTFVCDVGNHSFWATNAYAYSGATNRVLYSGSFGTLGSALPKAVGAYYSKRKPVVCFTGDQGFQMNIQEMQYIASHKLPVTVVILNNNSSGMIREREVVNYNSHFVHTTTDSDYSLPNFEKVAATYGFGYRCVQAEDDWSKENFSYSDGPMLIDLKVDEHLELVPNLPQGNACQDLFPLLNREQYDALNAL